MKDTPFKYIAKIIISGLYFIIAIVLIIEACTPGNVSADQSSKASDKISSQLNIDFGNKNEYVNPEKLTLKVDDDKTKHYVGESATILTQVTPENASNKAVIFESSNEKVAGVSKTGTVYFRGVGSVTIKATIKNTNIQEELTLEAVEQKVSKFVLNASNQKVEKDGIVVVYANISPITATFRDVSWTVLDENILEIQKEDASSITLKAKNIGKTKVIGNLLSGKIQEIEIEVIQGKYVAVEEIRVEEEFEIFGATTKKLNVEVLPQNATNKTLSYKFIGDSRLGNITLNGDIITRGIPGEFQIEITSNDSPTIKKLVTVRVLKKPITDFDLIFPDEVEVGTTHQVTTNLRFEDMYERQIEARSSDDNILKINELGQVVALEEGEATIYYKIDEVEKSKVVKVIDKLDIKVEKIEKVKDFDIYVGITYDINDFIKIMPLDATDKSVSITADENVLINGTKFKFTTSSTSNLKVKANSSLDVFKEFVITPKTFQIDEVSYFYNDEQIDTLHLNVYEKITLTTIHKINTNTSYTPKTEWVTSDNKIASVDSMGNVTGLKKGEAYIYIQVVDTNASLNPKKAVKVIVEDKALERIEITNGTEKIDEIEILEGKVYQINYEIYPKDAKNAEIRFATSNEKTVTIDEFGKIRARKGGTAIITLSSINNPDIKQEILVKVKSKEIIVDIPLLKTNKLKLEINTSEKIVINKESMPTVYTISYRSSNSKIAEMTPDGIINAKKRGTAICKVIIQASDDTEKIFEFEVTVEDTYVKNVADFHRTIRKGLGHFSLFMIFGIVGSVFFILFYKKNYLFIPVVILIGFIVAYLTEKIQTVVPGRVGTLSDIMIDFYGYLVGTIFVFALFYITVLFKHIIKQKRRRVYE